MAVASGCLSINIATPCPPYKKKVNFQIKVKNLLKEILPLHKLLLIQCVHFHEPIDFPLKRKFKNSDKIQCLILTVCIANRTPVAANGCPIDKEPPQLFHLFKSGVPTLPGKPICVLQNQSESSAFKLATIWP